MLRSVIAAYIEKLKSERDLHRLLHALLPEDGYEKVAIVHGPREHGRDVIAQLVTDGIKEQIVFQAKLGDVRRSTVDELLKQITLASITHFPHEDYDNSAPLRIVVVTNGAVQAEAKALIAEASESLSKLNRSIETWDQVKLTDVVSRLIPEPMAVGALRSRSENPGAFLQAVGLSALRQLTLFDIEEYSRRWLHDVSLLQVTVEASVLYESAVDAGETYVSLYILLGLQRALYFKRESLPSGTSDKHLEEAIADVCVLLKDSAKKVTAELKRWLASGERLANLMDSSTIITASVTAHRWLEACLVLLIFGDSDEQSEALRLSQRLVETASQSSKPVSDKYAVTVFWLGAYIYRMQGKAAMRKYLKQVTKWICDRYEHFGLGSVDDPVDSEVQLLIGYAFEGVPVDRRRGSLLSTAILDCCVVSNDRKLYTLLLNEILAVRIMSEEYVVASNMDRFLLTGESVKSNFNLQLEYEESSTFWDKAQHWVQFPDSEDTLGELLVISLLLRDRWFPSAVRTLLNRCEH